MPEYLSKKISDTMLGKMLKCMSTYTSWNVTVGITRSKIIQILCPSSSFNGLAQKRCWPTRQWARWLRPRTLFERPRSWAPNGGRAANNDFFGKEMGTASGKLVKNTKVSMEKCEQMTGTFHIRHAESRWIYDQWKKVYHNLSHIYLFMKGPFTSVISAHVLPRQYSITVKAGKWWEMLSVSGTRMAVWTYAPVSGCIHVSNDCNKC